MKWFEMTAIAPLALIGIAAVCGSVALLYQIVAESPLINGAIVLFSFWLVIGCFYLRVKNR